MSAKVKFDTDNLIYNRYDLIHQNAYNKFSYNNDETEYEIEVCHQNGVAEVNQWGKQLPEQVMSRLVEDIFSSRNVFAIKITRNRNQYKNFLEETNDIRVPLPDSFQELMNRAERRDRATIRRKLRWLDERVGNLTICVYEREKIPDFIVETYFQWKKETHKTEYGLTSKEYLDKYYVTDAMLMNAGETMVAVAFFCQVEDIVFFENFSYNSQLKEYSPGLLMYVKMMEELIRRRCRYLYLGGGSYIYKKRFGAESFKAYSGLIYRQEILAGLNEFFDRNGIFKVAFYGFGVCGHSFLQLSHTIRVSVLYGIDRDSIENAEIKIYSPDEILPEVDAVFITMNTKYSEVEDLLKKRFKKIYYWNDILKEVITDYRRRVNEGN